MYTPRHLHFGLGVLTILLFLLTGQYMHWVHGHLVGMAVGPRMFFRAAHIYLLWAGVVNVLLGCYLDRIPAGYRRHLQTAFSLMLLATVPMLVYSFFYEAYNTELLRPIGKYANILAFIGAAGQACLGPAKGWRGAA